MNNLNNDFVLNDELLEKLNQFTRKPVTADEVYTFPITLCDNEIDRDGERFSVDAINKLAELFIGKTGIFDHDTKSEKQTARIFDCEVKTNESKITSTGEVYTYLCAKAYMMKTEKNKDLISEIEGGIKKEVSISCTVKKKLCSICNSDRNENSCGHIKGRTYDGVLCCDVLEEPVDAYEWSFVAVPAQVNAGVTKHFSQSEKYTEINKINELEKCLNAEREINEKARDLLKREILSLSFLCRPIAAVETVKMLTDKMSFDELERLYKTLKKQTEKSDFENNVSDICQKNERKLSDNGSFKLNP